MEDSKKVDAALSEMKDKIHQGALFVVGNSKDITALQEWQVRQNGTLIEIKECLKKIEDRINSLQLDDIATLRLELSKGKPSWAVAFILAGLLSITTGATIFALKTASP